MAKNTGYWGIDIGQCALKALRCRVDGGSIVADKYDYIEYPKILSAADADPIELVREALEQFLSRNEVSGDSIAISIPGQAGLSRFFKPPPIDAKTLPDLVKFEVKQQIPFPIEDVIWDWQQLGGTIVEGRTVDAEVGIFAMKREAVFRALKPFDEVEVEVDLIQLSPLSIFNVICNDILKNVPEPEDVDPENPPGSLVVMSMGTDTTDLIVSNGIKLWMRNIPIGGNHFTKQLARELKMTQVKAEHLKRNARQHKDPKVVFKAMRPVFSDLVNEVQRSLAFFQGLEKNADIKKIVLIGNAAKLPGLRQYLNKQLEIDIAKVTSFKNLTGDEVVGQKAFTSNLLSFAPAYGLCLQGLKKAKLKTNLLPGEIVRERIVRAKKPWVLASVSAILLGLMLGFFFKGNALSKVADGRSVGGKSWEQAKREISNQKTKSSNFVNTDEELKVELDKLNTLALALAPKEDHKTGWIELLSVVHQAASNIDEKLKDVVDSYDPTSYPFKDRDEIYIEHIDSKQYEKLEDWYKHAKPLYDAMSEYNAGEIGQANAKKPAATTTTNKPDKDGLKGPGWVVEIKGFHFHNNIEDVNVRDAERAYLKKTLIKNLEGEITLPDGTFTLKDFGIHNPTIVSQIKAREVDIQLIGDFTSATVANRGDDDGDGEPDGGASSGSSSDEEDPNVQKARRYDFWVQFAWTPQTPGERGKAKEERMAMKEKEDKDDDKTADDADDAAAKKDDEN